MLTDLEVSLQEEGAHCHNARVNSDVFGDLSHFKGVRGSPHCPDELRQVHNEADSGRHSRETEDAEAHSPGGEEGRKGGVLWMKERLTEWRSRDQICA